MDMLGRISASKMSTFMTCPLQAKFQYLDKLPRKQHASASFGTCVHHALDFYNNTGDLNRSVNEFLDVWENPEKLGVTPETWPKGGTYGGMRQRGIEMLRGYHDGLKWDTREVLATEHKFLVPLGEFEVTGFVDLLELRKNKRGKSEIRVVDYKTNKKQPFLNSLHLNIQFTTYAYAAEQPEFWLGNGPDFPAMENGAYYWEMYKDLPRRPIWYQLETQKEMDAGLRDDQDYMRLYRVCKEMAKAVKYDVFIPQISGDSCVFCPYTEPCGIPIPVPEEEDE